VSQLLPRRRAGGIHAHRRRLPRLLEVPLRDDRCARRAPASDPRGHRHPSAGHRLASSRDTRQARHGRTARPPAFDATSIVPTTPQQRTPTPRTPGRVPSGTSSRSPPDASSAPSPRSLTTTVFSQRSTGWFSALPRRTTPEGQQASISSTAPPLKITYIDPPSAFVTHGCRTNRSANRCVGGRWVPFMGEAIAQGPIPGCLSHRCGRNLFGGIVRQPRREPGVRPRAIDRRLATASVEDQQWRRCGPIRATRLRSGTVCTRQSSRRRRATAIIVGAAAADARRRQSRSARLCSSVSRNRDSALRSRAARWTAADPAGVWGAQTRSRLRRRSSSHGPRRVGARATAS
jgi:hypothetical protein